MKSTDLVIAAAMLAAIPIIANGDEPGPKPETLFEQLDKNKDGAVAGDEVGDDQKRLFERLVRRGDKDADGKLTKDEFLKSFAEDGNGDKPDAKGGERRTRFPRLNADEAFDRLDKNGDGKLTIDEFPEPVRERMAAIFTERGKDAFTKEEFEKSRARQRERVAERFRNARRSEREGDEGAGTDERPARRGPDGTEGAGDRGPGDAEKGPDAPPRRGRGVREGRGPMQVPKFVELLDADKDRKVSKDEFAKVSELFDKLDTNKDGSLDMPELLGRPPGFRRPGGGPDGGEGEGSRRGVRDRGPRDGEPKDGGPVDKGPAGPGDTPPPKEDKPQDDKAKEDGPDA